MRLFRRTAKYDAMMYYDVRNVREFIMGQWILRGERYPVLRIEEYLAARAAANAAAPANARQADIDMFRHDFSLFVPTTETAYLHELPYAQGLLSFRSVGSPLYGSLQAVDVAAMSDVNHSNLLLTICQPYMEQTVSELLAPRERRQSAPEYRAIWSEYAMQWGTELLMMADLKVAWAAVRLYSKLITSALITQMEAMYKDEIAYLESYRVPEYMLLPGLMTISSPSSFLAGGIDQLILLPDLSDNRAVSAIPRIVWSGTSAQIQSAAGTAMPLVSYASRRPVVRELESYAIRVLQAVASLRRVDSTEQFRTTLIDKVAAMKVTWTATVPTWAGAGRPIACSATHSELSDLVNHLANVTVFGAYPYNEVRLYPERREDGLNPQDIKPGQEPFLEVVHYTEPIARRFSIVGSFPIVTPSRWSIGVEAPLKSRMTALPSSVTGYVRDDALSFHVSAGAQAQILTDAVGEQFYNNSIRAADRTDREDLAPLYCDKTTHEITAGGYVLRNFNRNVPELTLYDPTPQTPEDTLSTSIVTSRRVTLDDLYDALPRTPVTVSRISFPATAMSFSPIKTKEA